MGVKEDIAHAKGTLLKTTISGSKYKVQVDAGKDPPGYWKDGLAELDKIVVTYEPPPPPPPPNPPPASALIKVVDYSTKDFSQWDWGCQINGAQSVPKTSYPAFDNYANRGSFKILDELDGVPNVCQIDLPAGDPSGKGLTHVSAEGIHQRVAEGVAIGNTEFFGMMVRIPSGFTLPPVFWGTVIFQYDYAGFYGYPIGGAILANGSISLIVMTGVMNGQVSSYYSGAPSVAPRNMAGPLYLVPTSMFERDKWFKIIVKVKWATTKTGTLAAWAKKQGDVNWTPTVPEISGIPTLQTDTAGNAPGGAKSDKAGAYTYQIGSPFRMYHANPLIKGNTFEVVAAKMGG